MKKILGFFISSKFVLSIAFLVNIALFVILSYFIGLYVYPIVSAIAFIIALLVLIHSRDESSYKLTWLFIIVLLPLYGTILYLYLKSSRGYLGRKKLWKEINDDYLPKLKKVKWATESLNPDQQSQSNYLTSTSAFPVYGATTSQYLPTGEEFFDKLLEKISQAKKYILLEFFIIKPGELWTKLEKALLSKVGEGVEVKILYDDFGCMDKFSRRYRKSLTRQGIDLKCFNRIRPTINRYINYRDHRKIAVIDGKIAFTGGCNIGDEYVNIKKRFGYWKDSGVMIEGPAVLSFIVLFGTNWSIATKKRLDITKYTSDIEQAGYTTHMIQPFGTGPVDKLPIARDNYIRMINNAKHYLYITTPYLILDGAMTSSLRLCAMSGVDVRIIVPGIPDKKLVYYLSRSYYSDLISAGVKIYEYTPGFIHSKVIVSDDNTACVSTINFDFRSLFLHFEDSVAMYNCDCITDIKQDYLASIKNSKLVSKDDIKKRKWYEKMLAKLLKFFAPLM